MFLADHLLGHKVMKQISCMNRLFSPWKKSIVFHADVIRNVVPIKHLEPFLTDKLSISHQGLNALKTKHFVKFMKKINEFCRIGISRFIKFNKHQRNRDLFVNPPTQDEIIDNFFAILPVGPIEAEIKLAFKSNAFNNGSRVFFNGKSSSQKNAQLSAKRLWD